MGSEDNSRIVDYDEAVKAMDSKDYDTAISSFQKCMKKLSSQGLGLTSELFPKCLQNIAACYNEKDEIEKALSFKKFEKLYYETVLLHNGLDGLQMRDDQVDLDLQPSRDRGDGSSEASADSITVNGNEGPSDEDESQNEVMKRASDYRQLARLCMQQECISLALEYSGKATLLYRHRFGDDHEETKKSFDLFTSIYAEAGKKEYSDSMDQANVELEENTELKSADAVEETLLRHRRNLKKSEHEDDKNKESKPVKRTRSILKKKTSIDSMNVNTTEQTTPDTPRRVTFADPLPQMVRLRDDGDSDDTSTNLLLFFLICLLIILVSLLVSALVCQMYPKVGACVEFRREITYYYNRMRYVYQGYLQSK